MQSTKNFLILLFSACIVSGIYGQNSEFKEVKTGDDVIENYITANGGRENLEKIKSIKMTGNVEAMGKTIPITVYTSHEYSYTNLDDPAFGFTFVADKKNKKGWQKAMGKVEDLPEDEFKKLEATFESGLWGHIIKKEKYNVNYELRGKDSVEGKPVYVIDFTREGKVLYTTYFDVSNFNRLKQVKNKEEVYFDDFRPVDDFGIKMPYGMTQQALITVEKYEFNTEFDVSLLKKPETKQ